MKWEIFRQLKGRGIVIDCRGSESGIDLQRRVSREEDEGRRCVPDPSRFSILHGERRGRTETSNYLQH